MALFLLPVGMRKFFILLALVGLGQKAFTQQQVCDSLLEIYCFLNPEGDTEAYCRGVNAALKSPGLVLRGLGDPWDVPACTYYNYRRFGVELILTGDIVLPEQEAENAGFNAVMVPRIKQELGAKYAQLGKPDSTVIEWSEQDFFQHLIHLFDFEQTSDTTVWVKVNQAREQASAFQTLDGVVIGNGGNRSQQLENRYTGCLFKHPATGILYLEIDFTNYSNPGKICNATGRFTLPVRLSQ